MSVNSKHSSGKNEKSAKRAKRKKLEDSEDLESSEEELDLTKECHPIGYYINDRAEMINQMFSVIKGNKLKAMLPPILKDCDLDLLKLQCLDQLLGMSEKRISSILDGEVLETSSESDVETNDYDSDEKKSSSCTTSNRSDNSSEDEMQNETEKKPRRKITKKTNSVDDEKDGKVSQGESNSHEQGKTLLEILELEMRARAIRALLKQNEITQDGVGPKTKASDSKENSEKEMSHEVVDLTGCEDDDLPDVSEKEGQETTSEDKTEKSQSEKGNQDQEKAKRMQAELEIQNKLFKKKVYRSRLQRKVNEEQEEDKPCVNEGPEEGEVSSSEDGGPFGDRQDELQQPKPKPTCTEESETSVSQTNLDTETKTVPSDSVENNTGGSTAESCTAQSVDFTEPPSNSPEVEEDMFSKNECLNFESEEDGSKTEGKEQVSPESEASNTAEETSWRERWLRKDGVQKLVKSSKIYAKVKKRIAAKSQRTKEDSNPVTETKCDSNTQKKLEIIEGSIKEYEKLVGKTMQPSECSVEKSLSQEEDESARTPESNSDADKQVVADKSTDNV